LTPASSSSTSAAARGTSALRPRSASERCTAPRGECYRATC
jgi:hypothetical protein